ncbi:ComEC/Rec2 family competence protein [Halocatena marina]|uniref:ComEC/Rec2 family competence protein n=1 Tax=Halocatena marina TaxID=2934937 RepID=UPI003606FA01
MSVDGERLDNGVLELHILDVGQADSTVIITERGEIVLNDADKGKVVDELETVLADRPIERTEDGNISFVFAATHFHTDHIKGLDNLGFSDYEVSQVIQPDERRLKILGPDADESDNGIKAENLRDYKNYLKRLSVEEITEVVRGDSVAIDSDTDISVLAPSDTEESIDVTRASTGAEVSLPPERPNENSAVYKLEGERSALFMGDVQDKSDHYGESWLIEQHDADEIDLGTDVLFVAHHGSANATSEEFLERADPEHAVISSDFGDQHGHPTDEVLENLHSQNVSVSWTAGHGTIRTDLDEALTTEQTTDLETTNAADLAALKYYCREHDVSPEQIVALTPEHLPEETPDWIAESAPMMVETTEEIVDAAIANDKTVEDVRYTLTATPDAHAHLKKSVQADRDEHVTTRADVNRNREAYFSAKRAEDAYERLPLHTRLRANFPNRFGGIDHPLKGVPASEEIDGVRDVRELPRAVKKPAAAELRAREGFAMGDIVTAEKATDNAVEASTTAETLQENLRETLARTRISSTRSRHPMPTLHTKSITISLRHSTMRMSASERTSKPVETRN